MALEDDVTFGFNASDADQLLRGIGKTSQKSTPHDTYDATRLVIAYTTAGATARSGTTLGVGEATIYYLAVSGADRVLTSTSIDVDFFNLSTTAVGATKYIMLLRAGDVFVCNWEDC